MKNNIYLSWNDRFALIDQYQPTDQQVLDAFSITQDELTFAREMRAEGYFEASSIDVQRYKGIFDGTMIEMTQDEQLAKPLTATKKMKIKIKKKRGRKGDKITNAFLSVPREPTDVETFSQQHGISVPVLRQSKRFLSLMEPSLVAQVGTIIVKKDKATNKLMIWRD